MSEVIKSRVGGRGLAFVPYPYERGDDYGMAWHSREWVEETMRELHGSRVRLLRFEPHGLDAHQDVFAFQRVS